MAAMSATLLELSVRTVSGSRREAERSALVERLLGEVAELRREVRELRWRAGYWKGMFEKAKRKIGALEKEIDDLRAENRRLKDQLFAAKSEKKKTRDRSNGLGEGPKDGKRPRGQQSGKPGPGRCDLSHLPEVEETAELPADEQVGPHCGKPAAEMSDSEDSEVVEIEVRAYRRRIRRKRYRHTCDCPQRPQTLIAPAPAKLIPKGRYGVSVWVHVLLAKFSSHRALGNVLEGLKATEELADAKLREPCRKALQSLRDHWPGLIRFVDDPKIPMDNNASERRVRGPAMGRKNYYGSGSLWSVCLTAAMFSILATLKQWSLDPRRWLSWYLESCAAAGGRAPDDVRPFLPWNLPPDRRAELATAAPSAPVNDTS